jgi:hypothetical protein
MAQQELDLLQFTAGLMAEPGTRSPEVVWCEFRYAQPFRVFLHNVPDHFLCNLHSANNTFTTNTSENLAVYDIRDSQPVVDRLLHPIGHRNRADVSSFPNEVNYGPVVFAALKVVKGQINEFSSARPTPQENRQDGSISFTLHAVHVRKLPQLARLIHGQPIPKPHAQLFCSFHATDASSEFRAQESCIRRLVSKSSNGRQPYVDCAWCQQLILKMDSIPCDDRLVEGHAWL